METHLQVGGPPLGSRPGRSTHCVGVPFNNIQRSSRHQSGYALRFPRIVRLRPDKPVSEIDRLDRVKELYDRQASPTAGVGSK